MSEAVIDVKTIQTVWGDRVLVRRLNEPEKKRGLFVPASYSQKKEPRKVWWAEVVQFGVDSRLAEDHRVAVGDVVGVEPLGHHYASFTGADGATYVWVPDEHFCLADAGDVEAYYRDAHDRTTFMPRLRLLGERVLLRPAPADPKASKIVRPHGEDSRDAKVSDVVLVGQMGETSTRPQAAPGDRVLHVVEDSGASALVDLYEPPLTVLRAVDLIGTVQHAPKPEEAHA
jgi:co-chaperonin GroES (HSP10)